MLVRSEEKLMYHTSARFYVVISTKWILIDTRSKNIQKNRKFGWTIRIQHWPDKQGS